MSNKVHYTRLSDEEFTKKLTLAIELMTSVCYAAEAKTARSAADKQRETWKRNNG